jgi:putative PEP-CTERM system TPR-repeat lipoprotein
MSMKTTARSTRNSLLVLTLMAAACSRDPEALKKQHVASGDAYMAQQKYAEAILEYRNATQLDPMFGEARHKLATAYINAGERVRALGEAVRAADLMPQDADVQLQATNLLILSGRFPDAQDRVQKLLKLEPHNVRATIALGNALAGLRDLDGALSQLEEAIRLDPSRVGTYTNLATLQLGSGKLKEAEETYRKAVAKAPQHIPSVLALTQFYWLTGRVADAEAQLNEALKVAPRDSTVNRFAAAFYQTTGRPERAEAHFKTSVEAEGTARAHLALAEYYLASSRLSDAKGVLTKITTDVLIGDTARVRLATIDYAQGQTDSALATIDAVLKTKPRLVEAIIVKASILFDQKKLDDALALTSDAVKADSSSVQAHFARGRVLLAKSQFDEAKDEFGQVLKLNPRAAGAQVELAKLHLHTGATASAAAMAGAAVSADPRRADARLLLARTMLMQGDFAKAEAVLTDLAKALPDSPTVHSQLGWLRLAKKDNARATAEFQRTLELDPKDLDGLSGMVALDLVANRREGAYKRIEEAMARSPQDPAVLTLAGRTYLTTGKYAEAEAVLKRAIAADASGALDAYSYLGQTYLQQRRIDDARREFEGRAQREARPVAALTMVGLIHQMQNRRVDAQRVFEQVLSIDPKASVAANNLAWIYAETGGNLDVALQLAQTARAALPDSSEISDTLGWVYLKKGLYPLAVKTLRQAVEQTPDNPMFHYHLGLAYARSGEPVRAKTALQTALRLRPDFQGADDAKRTLASL